MQLWLRSPLQDNFMDSYPGVQAHLRNTPATWLVTGGAGFIGSHLVEQLLALNQRVVVLDNFATGYRHNLEAIKPHTDRARFRFIKGDIRNLNDCRQAVEGVDFVLHHAALGSVPRSLEDPLLTNAVNVTGVVNMLVAARDEGVKRFVYASSSSTYGDHPALPKSEEIIGAPLSPYAVTKYVNELYADVFSRSFGVDTIGLRYFNVFGPRQDPAGAYAAVIPRWFDELLQGRPCRIYGDGDTSRDFCHIDNVVQANLLAATTLRREAINQVYNVAYGGRTTLDELYCHLRDALRALYPRLAVTQPLYEDFRAGDVRHSHANIAKAVRLLGYKPSCDVATGLAQTAAWFVSQAQTQQVAQSGRHV